MFSRITADLHKKHFIVLRRAPCVFWFMNTTCNVYALAHGAQQKYRQANASGQSKPVSHEYNHVL